MEGYTHIGRLLKPHGLAGELKLWVEDSFLDAIWDTEVLYIEQTGRPLPFFVEHLRGKGALIVKLEELDKREDALLLSHKEVFLRTEDLDIPPTDTEEASIFERLRGFRLVDVQMGELGRIDRLEEYPQQWMAVVERPEGEQLIPLVPAFILDIDEEKQCIRLDLPEGLLEL